MVRQLIEEKGPGCWLNAPPLKKFRCSLDKSEFRDTLHLSYCWDHNHDLNAELQREVCRDVVLEPALIPPDNEQILGTYTDWAAPDVSSRGPWSTFNITWQLFMISVSHILIFLPTRIRQWNRYITFTKLGRWKSATTESLRSKRGHIHLLYMYTRSGGWGPQSTCYHKRRAELMSLKRGEKYTAIISYIWELVSDSVSFALPS